VSGVNALLTISAVIEAAAGLAFAIAPSTAVLALLRSPCEAPACVVIGRVLGAALFSLGAACWGTRGDTQGRRAEGLIRALLLDNLAAASVLGHARIGLGMAGLGLWPGVSLHLAMGVWCVATRI
jgi:hypothetical protein